jgi:hypothetical protein
MSSVSTPYVPSARHPNDTCGCIKPHGAWGKYGWHWTPMDRDALVERQVKGWAEAGNDPEEFRYDDRHEAAYLGQPAAYEPCPLYREGVKRGIEKRAREGKTRKAGDEF